MLNREIKKKIKDHDAQLEQINQKKAEKTEVNSLKSDKADLSFVLTNLNNKRDKSTKITKDDLDTSSESVKIGMNNLSQEVKNAISGTAPVSPNISDGQITTEKLADGILKLSKSGTSLGSMQDQFYFSNKDYYMTTEGTNIKIRFKVYTAGFYKNIERKDITSFNNAETSEYIIPTGNSLVYNFSDKYKLYVKPVDDLNNNDVILITNLNGVDVVNNIKKYRNDIFNQIVFVGGVVKYEVVNGSIVINIVGDNRVFIRTGNSIQNTLTAEMTYSIPDNNVLVANLYNNSILVKSYDNLSTDDVVLCGNKANKLIQNNINAISFNDPMFRQYDDDVIFYGTDEGVYVEDVSGDAIVTFSKEDARLFYRTNEGNKQIVLTTFSYAIPSNHALVLNKETLLLEVVDLNNIIRGKQLLLLAVRYGKVIKSNIRHIEKPSLNTLIPKNPRIIDFKKSFTFPISQDGTVVGDEIWLFDESLPDHVGTAPIRVLDKETLAEKASLSHSLGHANGVDYRNNKLLVYNGAMYPPEICLYSNPIGKTQLLFEDEENIQIVFEEGTKTLEGDGTACFGENEKIFYYNAGYGTIYKFLLGMGDNDLSDKTIDKSDMSRWGTFKPNKSEDEYNGTAMVLQKYTPRDRLSPGEWSPQGMCYDGFLYLQTGFEYCHAYKVELLDDSTHRIVDDYWFNHTNYKNENIEVEPECVFIIDNKIHIGCRRTDDSFLVRMSL